MMYKVLAFMVTAIGFGGCIAFVLAYIIRSRGAWRHSEAGRFLVIAQGNLALLFLLIMAGQLFGDWPGRRVVSLLLYTMYAVEGWWPLRLLIYARRKSEEPSEID